MITWWKLKKAKFFTACSKFDNFVYKKLNKRVPYWTKLNYLGKSRILKTSYFWFVLVPLSAKVFEGLNKTLTFTLFDATITVHLQLPFSWQLFYFSSVAFSIALIIYEMYCPAIIKQYESFTDFTNKGKTQLSLRSEVFNAYQNPNPISDTSKRYAKNFNILFIHQFVEKIDTEPLEVSIHPKIDYKTARKYVETQKVLLDFSKFRIPQKLLNDAFEYFYISQEHRKLLSRIFCVIFYAIGFIFIGLVFLQNFLFVLQFVKIPWWSLTASL